MMKNIWHKMSDIPQSDIDICIVMNDGKTHIARYEPITGFYLKYDAPADEPEVFLIEKDIIKLGYFHELIDNSRAVEYTAETGGRETGKKFVDGVLEKLSTLHEAKFIEKETGIFCNGLEIILRVPEQERSDDIEKNTRLRHNAEIAQEIIKEKLLKDIV